MSDGPYSTKAVAEVSTMAWITQQAVALKAKRPAPSISSVVETVYTIHKLGQTLHRLYEQQCNGAGDSDRLDARVRRLQVKVNDAAAQVGLTVRHFTDPRGWPLIVAPVGYGIDLDSSRGPPGIGSLWWGRLGGKN